MKITEQQIRDIAANYAQEHFNKSPTAYYAFISGYRKALEDVKSTAL
jgi:hypothetical protein